MNATAKYFLIAVFLLNGPSLLAPRLLPARIAAVTQMIAAILTLCLCIAGLSGALDHIQGFMPN